VRKCELSACDVAFAPHGSGAYEERFCSERCGKAVSYVRNKAAKLARQAVRLAERRARIIKYLGGCCAKCGATEELDVDHIDARTKSFKLSGGSLSCYWEDLLPELAKCQLLCRPCHVEKTALEYPKAAAWLRAAPRSADTSFAAIKRLFAQYANYQISRGLSPL
jgi:5-methylcytosine-specific restriction endonuclease McrA